MCAAKQYKSPSIHNNNGLPMGLLNLNTSIRCSVASEVASPEFATSAAKPGSDKVSIYHLAPHILQPSCQRHFLSSPVQFVTTVIDWFTCWEITLRSIFLPSGETS